MFQSKTPYFIAIHAKSRDVRCRRQFKQIDALDSLGIEPITRL